MKLDWNFPIIMYFDRQICFTAQSFFAEFMIRQLLIGFSSLLIIFFHFDFSISYNCQWFLSLTPTYGHSQDFWKMKGDSYVSHLGLSRAKMETDWIEVEYPKAAHSAISFFFFQPLLALETLFSKSILFQVLPRKYQMFSFHLGETDLLKVCLLSLSLSAPRTFWSRWCNFGVILISFY